MSWSDEEIDGLFREAASRAEVPPYQDSFFDEIAHLLPEQKKKRRGIWWFIPLGILVLGSSAAWVLLADKDSDKSVLTVATTNDESNKLDPAKTIVDQDHQTTTTNVVQASSENSKEHSDAAIEAFAKELFKSTDSDYLIGSWNPLFVQGRAEGFHPEMLNNPAAEIIPEQKPIREDLISDLHLNILPYSMPLSEVESNELQVAFPFKFAKRHHLYLGASAGLSEAYVLNGSSTRAMPVASLDFGYQYRKKMYSFEIGLSFSSVKPSDLTLNRSSKVYGFDVNYYSQSIKYRSISCLELPMTLRRNMGNHSFGIGVAPSFMLGSVIDFTKVQNGKEIENSRIYGNKLGLNTWGLKPHFNYLFRIHEQFELGVQMNVQLIQPIDDSKFIGERKQLPFSGQITFRKYFTIK